MTKPIFITLHAGQGAIYHVPPATTVFGDNAGESYFLSGSEYVYVTESPADIDRLIDEAYAEQPAADMTVGRGLIESLTELRDMVRAGQLQPNSPGSPDSSPSDAERGTFSVGADVVVNAPIPSDAERIGLVMIEAAEREWHVDALGASYDVIVHRGKVWGRGAAADYPNLADRFEAALKAAKGGGA